MSNNPNTHIEFITIRIQTNLKFKKRINIYEKKNVKLGRLAFQLVDP
jgi:hypothetical protein